MIISTESKYLDYLKEEFNNLHFLAMMFGIYHAFLTQELLSVHRARYLKITTSFFAIHLTGFILQDFNFRDLLFILIQIGVTAVALISAFGLTMIVARIRKLKE